MDIDDKTISSAFFQTRKLKTYYRPNCKIAESAHAIFLTELTYLTNNPINCDVATKWFEDELFQANFLDHNFEIKPYSTNPFAIYFPDETVNERFIYTCQELAWQTYYFLSNYEYSRYYSTYNNVVQMETTATTVGTKDFSRRISISTDEESGGHMPSHPPSPDNSINSFSDLSPESLTLQLSEFAWDKIFYAILITFDKTYSPLSSTDSNPESHISSAMTQI